MPSTLKKVGGTCAYMFVILLNGKAQFLQLALGPADSNTGYLPSLIKVVDICLMKARTLSCPVSAEVWLIRLGGCPG